LVERLVSLGSATQVFLRLAAGTDLQVVLQNDGTPAGFGQGTPVHAFLAPDALRVLAGGGQVAGSGDDADGSAELEGSGALGVG
jgi:hypothetical protein